MPVSDTEISELAATHDIISIGVRADEARRALHGAETTFVRVAAAPAEGDLPSFSAAAGEIRIEGVYIAKGTFPLALQLLERNEFGFDRLITHQLDIDRFWDAVELSRSGDAVKALVVP